MTSQTIKNKNDARYAHVVDENTLVVDFRKSPTAPTALSGRVRAIANRHFFGSTDGIVEDAVDGKHSGFFLGGNTLHVFHVASIQTGMWVVSTKMLTAEQTRPIVQAYIGK